MTTYDGREEIYNNFTYLADIPKNIINYLIENDDVIWKYLHYTDPDAFLSDTDHPNLTSIQKAFLIYDGLRNETDCRVFLNLGQDYSWTIEAAILRLGLPEIIPSSYVRANVFVGFEILCHYKTNMLRNYQSRDDAILQRLLTVLNGAEIEHVGRLFFDTRISAKCKSYMIGQIPYRGKALIMGTNFLG